MAAWRKHLPTAIVLATGLAACAPTETDIAVVHHMTNPDSAFQAAIEQEYALLAEKEMAEVDWLHRDGQGDADWFLRLAGDSGSGVTVLPTDPNDWNVSGDALAALVDARGRLMAAFDRGARETSPALAAHAQAMFDCWVEEEDEGMEPEDIGICRDDALRSITRLEPVVVAEPVAPEPAPMPEPVDPGPIAGPFNVYFDHDSAVVDSTATEALRETIKAAREFPAARIFVRGHTDTSGDLAYNRRLSQRRAENVVAALVEMGLDPNRLATEFFGEERLKVPTPDQEKLRTNRRVEIWLDG